MTWIDKVILGIIIFAVVLGFWHGFLHEAITFFIFLAAISLAFVYTPYLIDTYLADLLTPLITDAQRLNWIGFSIIFVAVLGVGMIINFLVGTGVGAVTVGLSSRCGGGILGLARGSLIVSVLLLGGKTFNFTDNLAWSDSTLIPYFMQLADFLVAINPLHPPVKNLPGPN